MNDSYAEWLVKRKNPAYNIVLKAALVLLCAISLVLAAASAVLGACARMVPGFAHYSDCRGNCFLFRFPEPEPGI